MSIEFDKLHGDIAKFLKHARIKTPQEMEIGSNRMFKGLLLSAGVAAVGLGALFTGATYEYKTLEYAGLGLVMTDVAATMGAFELWERSRRKWIRRYLDWENI